jgi:hypothetical protein
MKKITLLFLSAALGASVFAATPKFEVGDKVTLGGKVLVVVSLDDNGDPLFKSKDVVKSTSTGAKVRGFLDSLFASDEPETQETHREVAERETNTFLQNLRDELRKQGKEPCNTCYSMMEPGDSRIPKEYCNSLMGCE